MPIDEVLPAGAVGAESWAPWPDLPLPPEEAVAVAGAAASRRAEFAAGRDCARRALRRLGRPPGETIGRRVDGSPGWPAGVVGSITHTGAYAAAAAASAHQLRALGIDAEPAEPLPAGVLELVCSADEVAWAMSRPGNGPWDRLLFSAKESAVKAWSGVTGRLLDLRAVSVVIDRDAGVFEAGTDGLTALPATLRGRFATGRGLVLTSAAIPGR